MSKRILKTILALVVMAFLLHCNYDSNISGLHYFSDMHDSLAVESQEEDYTTLGQKKGDAWERGMEGNPSWGGAGSSVRVPPQNSVPRNYQPYPYGPADFTTAGAELKNPLALNSKTYARGQRQFTIFCAVCHGHTGLGDGAVVPQFPDIPSLMTPRLRQWRDGEYYHIITVGRGRMLPYAAQIQPRDRWAIISYIRLLQAQLTSSSSEKDPISKKEQDIHRLPRGNSQKASATTKKPYPVLGTLSTGEAVQKHSRQHNFALPVLKQAKQASISPFPKAKHETAPSHSEKLRRKLQKKKPLTYLGGDS